MAVKPIITVPDERLRAKCSKVTDFGQETKNTIQDMLDTLIDAKDPEGAGLAAPQIGVLKRIVIVRNYLPNPENDEKPLIQNIILVNPKIISNSKETDVDWEGCLSIPNTWGKVERFKKIKIRAQDENGDFIKINAGGYLAAVLQHEIDHLDGILFTTKVIGDTITEEELDKLYEEQNA